MYVDIEQDSNISSTFSTLSNTTFWTASPESDWVIVLYKTLREISKHGGISVLMVFSLRKLSPVKGCSERDWGLIWCQTQRLSQSATVSPIEMDHSTSGGQILKAIF